MRLKEKKQFNFNFLKDKDKHKIVGVNWKIGANEINRGVKNIITIFVI